MSDHHSPADPRSISRRAFVRTAAGVAAAAALPAVPLAAADDKKKKPTGESLAAQLHGSLTDAQKHVAAFPFDHALRSRVDNNWMIVKHSIQDLFTRDQQDLIRQIFLSLHSDAYKKSVLAQVEHDNRADGGLGGCAVAFFGKPGTGKFEFVLSGRHVTRRADGDAVDGAAFGGPIFYGHAARGFREKADHKGNVYWYQAKSANTLFQALDGRQRKLALRTDPRRERGNRTVELTGEPHGIPGTELTADQKDLVRQTLRDLLAPFRPGDVAEVMKLIEAGGGIDALHMAYYSNKDIGNDGVWDVWQIQSRNMIWYFRGAPHVHTWVRVRAPQ